MGILDSFLGAGGGGATTLPIGQTNMPQMSPDQWNNNPASTPASGVGAMFADPNFVNFLAGTGAALDPDGVGGAVGKATQAVVQNKQMGKAMAKQDARWQSLIEAMAGGKVGKATLKEDGKGGTTVTLGAPEGGLGALNQPVQQQQAPEAASIFDQYMQNIQSFQQKWGGK